MDAVVKDGDAQDPKDFAQNTMEIAVPPVNPGKVNALAEDTRRRRRVGAYYGVAR